MKYLKVFTDFAEAIEPFGDAEVGRLFKAMLEYAESGTEPDFRGNERFIWPAAKQNIDRTTAFNEKQRENGSHGGRPKNPTKPNETQNNQSEPNKSLKEKDKEKDKDYITPLPPFEGELASAFADWLAYKKERREPYKETGLKSLITQIQNAAKEHGDAATAQVIRDSMASGYRGIVFDRLKRGKKDVRGVSCESAAGYRIEYNV